MKKILFFIFSLIITFTSCKEEEPLPISVESVKLNHSSITLVIGESDMLIATVSPNNAENKKVSWSSSDKKVATVINGEVTAIKEGVANIIVMTEDGGHTAKCVVTVKKETDKEDDSEDGEKDDENENDGEKIPVTGLSLDIESLSMTVGDEQILTATLYPSNASNKNILWNSSSPDVARVSNGKVTAVSVGTTEITATTEDGGHTATCIITVSSEVLWGIIGSMNEFGETELIMSEDDYENYYVRRNVSMDMYDYFVFFNYDGSEEYYGTYSEDDFAPINNKISIVKEGFSFVVADAGTYDVFLDKSLKCCYIMENGNSPEDAIAIDGDDDGDDDTDDDGDDDDGSIPVESISLDNESLSMVIGEEQILTATIYPSNATNCNIIWESSSPDVVSVDNGKVIALSVGSSEITAKTEDGGYTATCSIMVSSKTMWGLFGSVNDYGDTELIMSEDDYENYYVRRNVSMDMYDSFVFLNYNGSDEYYGSDTESDFVSINNKSAIVKEGYFFNVADAGTYDVFLAKSLDYCFVMETGEIPDDTEKVISVTGISLSKTSITLMEGNSTTLTATVIPSDASDKSVKWYSNNTSVAIVNNGEVTAIAEGNAIITVETNDGGYTATCNVTVTSQNSGDNSGGADPDDHTKISVKVNLQEIYVNNDWSDDEWEEQLNNSYNSNYFAGFGANFKEIKYENGWLSICFDGDVTTIPDRTGILYLSSATSIVLPNSITYIADKVFQDTKCSINFPESLQEIGKETFAYATWITNLVLPQNVVSIGESAFFGCSNMRSLTLPSGVENISSNCFYNCSGLSELTIPSTIKSIGDDAFYGCSGLRNLKIGNNTTVATMTIGEYSFQNCSALTTVEIGSEVETIGNCAFKGCSKLSHVAFGENNSRATMKIGAAVFQNCSLLEEVIFGTEVSEIGVASFESCTSLESFTIPESVITIGTNAFKNCTNVKSVVIPGGVSSVGGSAFENCTSLQTLTIGNDDTSRGTVIHDYAFKGCTSLESTTLNKSVIINTYDAYPISLRIFEGSTGDIFINCPIDGIKYDHVDEAYAHDAILGKARFNTITIGPDISSIGCYFFKGTKFNVMNIGDNVTVIGARALSGCEGGDICFTDNSKLEIIGWEAFRYSSMNNFVMPESVSQVDARAFYGSSFNNLTISSKIKKIDYEAFNRVASNMVTIKCDLSNSSFDERFYEHKFKSIRIIGNYEKINVGLTTLPSASLEPPYELKWDMDKIIIEGTIKDISNCGIIATNINEVHLCKSVQNIKGFITPLTFLKINVLYCAATTPPMIYDDNLFKDTKIYVPQESVEIYKNEKYWSKYADNIIGYDFN